MRTDYHIHDNRGLIAEAYRIDGISLEECRTIFLDWALGRDDHPDEATQIGELLAAYGRGKADHPMSAILREGLTGTATPQGRKGGAAGRRS